MARIIATIPSSGRITYYISFGIVAKFFPAWKVRQELADTKRASVRERDIPSHVVYHVIAVALSSRSSFRELLRCRLEGLQWLLDPSATVKVVRNAGISKARNGLGPEPLRRLYATHVAPIGEKRAKGVWRRQKQFIGLVGSALDGSDTEESEKALGKSRASRGPSEFPRISFLAWLENRSHVPWAAYMSQHPFDGITLSRQEAPSLGKGMLCPADRFFLSYDL
jgi:hypothetical protein